MDRQRGFTLMEMAVVVAIAAIVAVILVGMSMSQKPGTTAAMRYDLISMTNLVTATAAGNPTGNGATLVITPNIHDTTLAVYDGRPNGNGFTLSPIRHTVIAPLPITSVSGQNGVASTAPIALFVDSFGSVTYKNWTPSATPMTLPACDASGASLSIGYSGGSVTLANCYAKITPENAGGTPLPEPTG